MGQNPATLSRNFYVDGQQDELYALLGDPAVDIRVVRILTDKSMSVTFKTKRDFLTPLATTSSVVAAFTTAHARLHLYKILDDLGHRICYLVC